MDKGLAAKIQEMLSLAERRSVYRVGKTSHAAGFLRQRRKDLVTDFIRVIAERLWRLC